MSKASQESGNGPAHRSVEIGVAAVTGLFGILIMAGSLNVGIGWDVQGPKSGFFPFYLGVIILGASAVNLLTAAISKEPDSLFADWSQLRSVLSVVVPTTVYVFAIPELGLYVSSAILIGVFMIWLGRYTWMLTLAVAIGVPVATFLIFEKWFLIPLPKGPIENWLGL
ncbi:MAG TPA: tripartite tricarboxylate transporter TctB family protein [Xanthobacteraceae bacterium]|nr:tripartite tricarboxylate transporter TctB family protein [Xanthobacteraceae bacterium]